MGKPERLGMSRDSAYMRRALSLARRGWGRTAPNPLVGAVVVRDNEVVGEGFHAWYGGDHAEVAALRAAGERARGATVYVTLEPCAHVGKTPPCVDALVAAGVARVVVAVRDPNPLAGGGIERLARAGIAVDVGVESVGARELNAAFFHRFASARPWITLKLAVSLDAAIADARGRSRWITGPRARRMAHWLRAGHDAVAVGIGTVLADDPALTVRGVPAPRLPPKRIVFDRRARLPLDSTLARSARDIATVVVAEDPDPRNVAALSDAGVEVVQAATLTDALQALRARAIESILVEGGARLAGACLASTSVDRLIIFQAPVVLGAGALGAFAHVPPGTIETARRYPVLERRKLGDDLMSVYAIQGC